jgi:hypothetical protein
MVRKPESGEFGDVESDASGILSERSRQERDELFSLLTTSTRRQVAAHLVASDEQVTVAELVDHLGAVLGTDTETLGVQLHHVELPKLAAAGAIAFDTDENVVRPGPALDAMAPYLDPELRLETDGAD